MLILPIAEYLDELLENSSVTAVASLRKLCRVMEMAIDLTIMFIITVLGAKDSWAYRTSKMIDMVFLVKCRDIRAS